VEIKSRSKTYSDKTLRRRPLLIITIILAILWPFVWIFLGPIWMITKVRRSLVDFWPVAIVIGLIGWALLTPLLLIFGPFLLAWNLFTVKT